MIIEIALKKPIMNPRMLGKVLFRTGVQEVGAQIVTSLTQECVPVHGVNNLAIKHKIAWPILQTTACEPTFQKGRKIKKMPVKYYECHRCGGSHPFDIYCPNVRDPPMIPGECRSYGTITREHANDCQYVAIKDNIGLCTYCQAQDHRYAACPQWAVDQEAAT